MREGLRAARGHRGLDHNDRPPPIIWNKVGVLTNQHPVLDQPLPGLEVLFQAHPPFHFAFPSVSVSGTHLPAPRTGIAQALRSGPCCREPGRHPGLRAPGGRRGESWSRQHGPQGLSPPRAAAREWESAWDTTPRGMLWGTCRPPAHHPGGTGQWGSMGFGEEPRDSVYPV